MRWRGGCATASLGARRAEAEGGSCAEACGGGRRALQRAAALRAECRPLLALHDQLRVHALRVGEIHLVATLCAEAASRHERRTGRRPTEGAAGDEVRRGLAARRVPTLVAPPAQDALRAVRLLDQLVDLPAHVVDKGVVDERKVFVGGRRRLVAGLGEGGEVDNGELGEALARGRRRSGSRLRAGTTTSSSLTA